MYYINTPSKIETSKLEKRSYIEPNLKHRNLFVQNRKKKHFREEKKTRSILIQSLST